MTVFMSHLALVRGPRQQQELQVHDAVVLNDVGELTVNNEFLKQKSNCEMSKLCYISGYNFKLLALKPTEPGSTVGRSNVAALEINERRGSW